MQETDDTDDIDIADVYPELTPEQREEAEYYLTRYIEVVRSIYEDVNGLTGSDHPDTIK